MTDNELYSMFITVGQIVSAKIMRDKSSGYSYGYGFVHYQQPEDAAKAIASLNGLQVIFTQGTLMEIRVWYLRMGFLPYLSDLGDIACICRYPTRGSRFPTADPTQLISRTQISMLGTFHRFDKDHMQVRAPKLYPLWAQSFFWDFDPLRTLITGCE